MENLNFKFQKKITKLEIQILNLKKENLKLQEQTVNLKKKIFMLEKKITGLEKKKSPLVESPKISKKEESELKEIAKEVAHRAIEKIKNET